MTKRVTQLSIPPLAIRNAALDAIDNGEPYPLWADQFACLGELQFISGTSTERASKIIRIGAGAYNSTIGRRARLARTPCCRIYRA